MRITKFKKTKDGKIFIAYEQANNNGDYDEFTLNCAEEARPELYDTLRELSEEVCEIVEFPEEDALKISVNGVSFNYGGEWEIMGATMICQKTLTTANCPLNFNTPNLPSEPYSGNEDDPAPLLSGNCVNLLRKLQEECELYIHGERKQLSLFANNKQDDAEQTDDTDALYARAEKMAKRGESVSVPDLQRHLNVNYTKANIIMSMMEANGVIGLHVRNTN